MITRKTSFLFLPLFCFLFLTCDGVTNAIRPFLLSDEDEIAWGNQLKRQIMADDKNYPKYTDAGSSEVIQYVRNLGQQIARNQDDRDIDFSFEVIDDTLLNAFAIPGGHVFVYTGLLKAAKDKAELAGVLAHEIAHVTNYHSANALTKAVLAEKAQDVVFSDSASLAAALSGLLTNLVFLKFSRDNEFEADSCSVAYTTQSGINPVGMKNFLTTLKNTYGEQPKIFQSFSTHPNTSERITKVQNVISKTSNVPSADSAMFEAEYVAIRNLIH